MDTPPRRSPGSSPPFGWSLHGTSRDPERLLDAIAAQGVSPILWPGTDPRPALAKATHLLLSVAPDENGDPVIAKFGSDMAQLAPNLEWVGYLSTTGVYGDHQGGWSMKRPPSRPPPNAVITASWPNANGKRAAFHCISSALPASMAPPAVGRSPRSAAAPPGASSKGSGVFTHSRR